MAESEFDVHSDEAVMFTHTRRLPKRLEPPPSGRVERVRLLAWPRHMETLGYQTGTVEGMVGDDVLVRFGDMVIRVPPEWLEPVDGQ